MSDINPMEAATGRAVETAAVALQVLVMAAKALREHQQQQAAAQSTTAPAPAPEQQNQPAPAPAPAPAPSSVDPDHERYAHLIRGTVQPPAVAEAMVNSPQWPQLADELKKLEGAGVNVAQFLTDAAPVIGRMDVDLRAGSPNPGVTASAAATQPRDPWAPPPGQEPRKRDEPGMIKKFVEQVKQVTKKLWAKVTGKNKPAPADRAKDLAKLGISSQENARLVIVARESLANESLLGQMVASRKWPGIAGQIKALQEAGHNPREALAGVPTRIQQAAAAGITLTPSEAARGLLTDMAKTPTPTPAPSPAPAPSGSAPSGPAPTATAPTATAPTATAPTATAPTATARW
ncbi:hypothetical protein [Streptomyces lavendulocolor]|uniref:hypothetical protein n=1 Tax=Streptomyces lavendulocolor TaxID=67316 RepID=UPI0033EC8080